MYFIYHGLFHSIQGILEIVMGYLMIRSGIKHNNFHIRMFGIGITLFGINYVMGGNSFFLIPRYPYISALIVYVLAPIVLYIAAPIVLYPIINLKLKTISARWSLLIFIIGITTSLATLFNPLQIPELASNGWVTWHPNMVEVAIRFITILGTGIAFAYFFLSEMSSPHYKLTKKSIFIGIGALVISISAIIETMNSSIPLFWALNSIILIGEVITIYGLQIKAERTKF